jgi:hypothetical protein
MALTAIGGPFQGVFYLPSNTRDLFLDNLKGNKVFNLIPKRVIFDIKKNNQWTPDINDYIF